MVSNPRSYNQIICQSYNTSSDAFIQQYFYHCPPSLMCSFFKNAMSDLLFAEFNIMIRVNSFVLFCFMNMSEKSCITKQSRSSGKLMLVLSFIYLLLL